jgi:hypothetical protein
MSAAKFSKGVRIAVLGAALDTSLGAASAQSLPNDVLLPDNAV